MHRKGGADRNLCVYEDFTIFESDFRSVLSSWLTDTAVNFAATFLKNELVGKEDDKIVLVYAFMCEMLKYTNAEEPAEAAELLRSVGVSPDKYCAFLLNDNADPTAVSGGTHWTLLLHDPVQKVMWQLDPMVDIRPVHCLAFFARIRSFLNDEYRVMPSPKMNLNGSCGIYVVEYLHCIFKYIQNGGRRVQEADLSGINDQLATKRRLFYCELINRLAVEQGKEAVVF
ncbi:hypothetical protein M3Y99_01520800 [Aphelenchoides fujianensis]|nr:hypothetical protein M3Y99_01520800 [Aphelenchoides fujianensis]